MRYLITIIFTLSIITGCTGKFDADHYLNYCYEKVKRTLNELDSTGYKKFPRSIEHGKSEWHTVDYNDWTSGFWPGILWETYEYTHDENIKAKADSFTMAMEPVTHHKAETHDLGFMVFTSFGNGYRLTQNLEYKKDILQASDSLATLFNPKVGTILSWPGMVKKMGWPHNTIIDNMMNLEMLFWASHNGENRQLYNIADTHAETTLKNQFRPDFSCYHVVVYDTVTGKKIKGVTHQGYSDNSMWARGQAWAIYGFTMSYRETHKKEYLNLVRKAAEIYLKRLPSDLVPYWDFDCPDIPNTSRDVSASAITASALLELSVIDDNKEEGKHYFDVAKKMLISLSSDKYLSGDKNSAFLLHSTGHKPNNSEVDVSIIYTDYYYLEALMRYKKIQEGRSIYDNL